MTRFLLLLLLLSSCPLPGLGADGVAGAEEPRLWRTVDDLPGNRVLALAQSGDGYLWVGTAYGLARFDGFRFSVFDPRNLGVANLGNVILEAGPGNTMWIGTDRGEALQWSQGKFTNCLPRGKESDAVWRIYPDGADGATILKKEGIWRWTRKDGARLLASPGPLDVTTGPQGITAPRTARDSAGTLYFFSLRTCWRLRGDSFEPVDPVSEGITSGPLWDTSVGTDGTMWLVSDRELLWLNPEQQWISLPALGESAWTGYILGNGPEGSIWLQINGRLRLASPAGWLVDAGVWPPNGLSSPAYTDASGRLWAALSDGTMRCIHPDGTAREFTGSSRIPGNKIARFLMDREGNLWGGTNDSGLVCWSAPLVTRLCGSGMFHPTAVPEIHLESCRLGDQETAAPFPPAGLTTAPGSSRMEFSYTAILLSAPESIRYRYRLHGLERAWRDTTSRRISYEAVPPGRYQFEIQAGHGGENWLPGQSVAVLVQSHFWQTGWFRLLAPASVAASAGLAGWLASRHRTARHLQLLEVEKLRSIERLRLARDLHDDLGSRLTHLSLLADLATSESQPDIHALNTLQNGLREAIGSLDEIVWAVDPRRDTLPDLAEYLATTLTDFFKAGNIQCELENSARLPAIPVPSDHRHHLLMALREAAQNILKHAGATLVILHWSFTGREFHFGLTDNGCGFDLNFACAAGDGLRNLRERLAACGGELHFHTSPGEGCRLTFSLPMTEQPHS